MDIADTLDIDMAAAELSSRLGKRVSRQAVFSWARDGLIPSFKRGRTTLIPRTAIALFRKPRQGRHVRRDNLAFGIGLALATLGQTTRPASEVVLQAACPRCDRPWVIRGGINVIGHEADLCCCNLACLYIGSDFLHRPQPDHRVVRSGDIVTMRRE